MILTNLIAIAQNYRIRLFPPKITQFQPRVECWRCSTDKTLKLNLERFAPLQYNLMIKMGNGLEKDRLIKIKNRPFIRQPTRKTDGEKGRGRAFSRLSE